MTPPPSRHTLDRALSKLGIASRTQAARFIREGKVRVNGKLKLNPSFWVSLPEDRITLQDEPLVRETPVFLLFHKPRGVITTRSDEKGRRTVFDCLPSRPEKHLHAVGRLDQATSGLLLLTNDTQLSAWLLDPRNEVPRTYLATVRGEFTEAKAQTLERGLEDQGEQLQAQQVKIRKRSRRETHLIVVLQSGKNREIRRLFQALGHEVTQLKRVNYGPFELGTLSPGECRELTMEVVLKLLAPFGFQPDARTPSDHVLRKPEANSPADE